MVGPKSNIVHTCDVMFKENKKYHLALETSGTLKTILYLCDDESFRSIVYIFWVVNFLHI